MSTTFGDPSDSDDSEIDRLRKIVARYESCEGPESKSDYLEAHGLTRPVIAHFRRIVEAADRRISSASETYTIHIRATRGRRLRRSATSSSSRPGGTTRTDGSSFRNRHPRRRVTFVIIIDYP
ncbi:hypothetical protein [Streptomyces mirabilis]|uniref:hypothetical protein n=1 Tax=Streptomyces mirabilis TaxID=68239 RepID=UPI002258DDC2|nr:hypothetical protein [Streptomyces mirabilis]MCX4609093.1 hypothetical protein [Streptomyces mirabilis]